MIDENTQLVKDSETFHALSDECNAVFNTTKRLPEYVFQRPFVRYYPFEHGLIMRKAFAGFLTNVARYFGDRAVNYMTLDPHPEKYYLRKYGFYGLASFEPSTLVDNYMNVMYRGGKADSFLARGGDIAVMWGSSRGWGIFCDRISWELCLMASSAKIDNLVVDEVTASTVSYMKPELLRSYVLNEYKHKLSAATTFLTVLTKNYPMLGVMTL